MLEHRLVALVGTGVIVGLGCHPAASTSTANLNATPNALTSPVSQDDSQDRESSRRFDVEGHRGDRGNVPPGNTLPSFESGLAHGIDTLEADMQITADGAVVMGHDDDLAETGCTFSGEGPAPSTLISSLRANEVARFDCHPELDGVQAPPSLSAALDFVLARDPELALNLELKRPSSADADIYLGALIAYQAQCDACLSGRLILQSFEWSALEYARARYGDELEFEAAILDKRGELEAIRAARGYAEIWSPRDDFVSHELVDAVHEIGMRVVPWTINEPGRMRELIEMGVDGIITDYPDVLVELLDRSPGA